MPPRLHLSPVILPIAALLLPVLCGAVRAGIAPTTPTFGFRAGGFGSTPGAFYYGAGAAADSFGNVYVADVNNHRVQKFDYLGNFLLQWGSSGSGDGQFGSPDQIALDAAGNVYVTDTGNHRVEKFTSSGAFLARWGSLGTGNGQFSSPEGIAIDASGNVYVVDRANNRIQKFTSSGTYVTQWGTAGAGDGQFDYPVGVAVDRSGFVYVAEYDNDRVQKFTGTGTFVTKWGSSGSGDGQFNHPGPIATDEVGNLYVGEYSGNRVQKFAADGTFLTKWGSAGTGHGQFSGPWGIAVDAAGNVYVSEWDGHRFQKFMGSGNPHGTRELPTFGTSWSPAASLTNPVAIGPTGDVYVGVAPTLPLFWYFVQRFTPDGTFVSKFGPDAPFGASTGISFDAIGRMYASSDSGWIYICDSSNSHLGGWRPLTTAIGGIVGVDPSGIGYFSDSAHSLIFKFSLSNTNLGQWGSVGSGDGQFVNPTGVATDAQGNVYVCDTGNARVQKFSSSGSFLDQWATPGDPRGISIDGSGVVYVTDASGNRIQRFTINGVPLGAWGSTGTGPGQFSGVTAVAASSQAIYTRESGVQRVQVFTPPRSPEIAFVSDVGSDQGGFVHLRILRSPAQLSLSGQYIVYRRIDQGIGLGNWEQVGAFQPRNVSEYDAVVPTASNSNASVGWYTAFFVRYDTMVGPHYDSAVEQGYSVDDIPPLTPSPFTAAYASGATHLHWGASSDADFSRYQLYRGASAAFVPGPGNLIATKSDTGSVDVGPAGSWYKLVAIDANENRSVEAVLGPAQTTDVSPEATFSFALEGMRPNPATTRDLMASFTLPSRAPARLELIDVAGRQVAAIDVGPLGPGRHGVHLARGARVHTGLYFVRLTQGANRSVARVTVLE